MPNVTNFQRRQSNVTHPCLMFMLLNMITIIASNKYVKLKNKQYNIFIYAEEIFFFQT